MSKVKVKLYSVLIATVHILKTEEKERTGEKEKKCAFERQKHF